MITDGYTILVTWPQLSGDRHDQDVWFAHLSNQAEAVKAVSERLRCDERRQGRDPRSHDG